jgi:hypothetical protein
MPSRSNLSDPIFNITSAHLTNLLLVETFGFNSLHVGKQIVGQNGPSSLQTVCVCLTVPGEDWLLVIWVDVSGRVAKKY